jgi:hypothetical protein
VTFKHCEVPSAFLNHLKKKKIKSEPLPGKTVPPNVGVLQRGLLFLFVHWFNEGYLAKFLKLLRKLVNFTLRKQKKFTIYTRTWDPFCFPGYLSHGTDLFTYLPPFNTRTLIKPTNEEEEEAPLEVLHVRWNRLARERHAPGLKKPRDFTMSEGHGYPLVIIIKKNCSKVPNSNFLLDQTLLPPIL